MDGVEVEDSGRFRLGTVPPIRPLAQKDYDALTNVLLSTKQNTLPLWLRAELASDEKCRGGFVGLGKERRNSPNFHSINKFLLLYSHDIH